MANWQAFETHFALNKNLWVSGPPGTGKSILAWVWALWKTRTTRKTAMWFHFGGQDMMCVISGMTGMLGAKCRVSCVEDILKYEGDILIVDGVTEINQAQIFNACSWWASKSGGWFAFISSTTVSIKLEDLALARVEPSFVESWVLEDYLGACQDDEFFKSVELLLPCGEDEQEDEKAGGSLDDFVKLKREQGLPARDIERHAFNYKRDLIKTKYYYVGGCARWMFEFPFRKVRPVIDQRVQCLGGDNFAMLLRGGGGAEGHLQSSVNDLRGLAMAREQPDEPAYFFVSQYVLDEFAAKASIGQRKFLHEVYYEGALNVEVESVYDEWAFASLVDREVTDAVEARKPVVFCIDGIDRACSFAASFEYAKQDDGKLDIIGYQASKLLPDQSVWLKPGHRHSKEASYDFIWVRRTRYGELELYIIKTIWEDHVEVFLNVFDPLLQSLEQKYALKIARVYFMMLTHMLTRPFVSSVWPFASLGNDGNPRDPLIGHMVFQTDF